MAKKASGETVKITDEIRILKSFVGADSSIDRVRLAEALRREGITAEVKIEPRHDNDALKTGLRGLVLKTPAIMLQNGGSEPAKASLATAPAKNEIVTKNGKALSDTRIDLFFKIAGKEGDFRRIGAVCIASGMPFWHLENEAYFKQLPEGVQHALAEPRELIARSKNSAIQSDLQTLIDRVLEDAGVVKYWRGTFLAAGEHQLQTVEALKRALVNLDQGEAKLDHLKVLADQSTLETIRTGVAENFLTRLDQLEAKVNDPKLTQARLQTISRDYKDLLADVEKFSSAYGVTVGPEWEERVEAFGRTTFEAAQRLLQALMPDFAKQ